MTEVVEDAPVQAPAEAKPVKRPKMKDAISKKNKIMACDCEEGPKPVPFVLFSPPPFSTFQGEKCNVCSIVLNYKAVEYVKNKEGQFLAAYKIARIAQGSKPGNVEFTCAFKVDEGFNIEMASTPEKVAKAVANPTPVIGRFVLIQFEKFSSEGMPLKGIALSVHKEEDVANAIEEAKKKK